MRLGAEKTLRGVSSPESNPIGALYPSVFMTVRGRTAENSAAHELVKRCRSPLPEPARLRGADKLETQGTALGVEDSKLQTPNSKPKLATRDSLRPSHSLSLVTRNPPGRTLKLASSC
jgi:hypothetical protein